jgi:hypothetical protein
MAGWFPPRVQGGPRLPRRRAGLTLLETVIGSAIAGGAVLIAAALLLSYGKMAREMATRDEIASRLDIAMKTLAAGAKPATRATVGEEGKSVDLSMPGGAVERWRIEGSDLAWESGGRPPAIMLSGLAPTSGFAMGPVADGGAPSLLVSLHLAENPSIKRYHALTVDAIVALRAPAESESGAESLP